MKRFYRFLIIAIIGISLGFLNGWLRSIGFFDHFFAGLTSLPWYVVILLIFVSIFLVVLVHELGHLLSFVREKIKIKAFYVLCFVFVKIEGKWKFKFFPKFLSLMGGLVAPDLPPVENEEDESKLIVILKKALLAGPNMSIHYCLILVALYLIMLITPLYVPTGVLFYLGISTILLTVIVVKASKVSYQGLYGDYVAEKQLEKNQRFTISYLISGLTYSSHPEISKSYLWKRTMLELDQGLRISQIHSITLLAFYLHQVVFEGEIGCASLNEKLNKRILNIPKTEDGFILYQYLIYLNHIEKGLDEALRLLEQQRIMNFKVSPGVKHYWEVYTLHTLKIADGSEYLLNPKNQNSSVNAWIFEPFELPIELPIIK